MTLQLESARCIGYLVPKGKNYVYFVSYFDVLALNPAFALLQEPVIISFLHDIT